MVVGLNFERTQGGVEHSLKKAVAIEVDLDFDSNFAIFEGDLAFVVKAVCGSLPHSCPGLGL